MKVDKLMSRDVAACNEGDSLNTAAQIMWERDCGFLPVVDEQRRVRGVVTDRDILMGAYTQGRPLREIPVSTVMSRDVRSCSPDDDLGDVERTLQQHQIRRVPVLDSAGVLMGVITLGDLAHSSQSTLLKKAAEGLAIAKTLSTVCEPRHRPAVIAAE